MRVVHAAALTAAALVLASVASAQGLGDAAARERNKRKAEPAQPAKVYTEGDIGRSMAPVVPDLPVTAEGEEAAPAEGQPVTEGEPAPEGAPAVEGQAPAEGAPAVSEADAERAKAEEEARAKKEADWRKRMDQARKEAAVYQDVIDKLQAELNDISGGVYNPARAAKMSFQEENKVLLAQTQGRIATLEEEGRRNNYR